MSCWIRSSRYIDDASACAAGQGPLDAGREHLVHLTLETCIAGGGKRSAILPAFAMPCRGAQDHRGEQEAQ